MPVQVKKKQYIARHKQMSSVRKTIDAINLEEAALTLIGQLGYELFEDTSEDVPFVMIPEPEFSVKRAILEDIYKHKRSLSLPLLSDCRSLCVEAPPGDGHLEPLSGEFLGK